MHKNTDKSGQKSQFLHKNQVWKLSKEQMAFLNIFCQIAIYSKRLNNTLLVLCSTELKNSKIYHLILKEQDLVSRLL